MKMSLDYFLAFCDFKVLIIAKLKPIWGKSCHKRDLLVPILKSLDFWWSVEVDLPDIVVVVQVPREPILVVCQQLLVGLKVDFGPNSVRQYRHLVFGINSDE